MADGADEVITHNAGLVHALQRLSLMYTLSQDPYRAKTFEHAARTIEQLNHEIVASFELNNVRGIGESTKQVIDEYLNNEGKITRLQQLEARYMEYNTAIETFTNIFGIGPKKAVKFVEQGLRTVDDLWYKAHNQLTKAQRLGILWREHMRLPVYRYEIDEIKTRLSELWGRNISPDLKFDITGSYRRGEPVSGDIDILVQQTPGLTMSMVVNAISSLLPDVTYEDPNGLEMRLDNVLAQGPTKYMGMVRNYNNNAHRIDIRLIDQAQYPFAILYFTGSKNFNKLMRSRAIEFGLTLNEYGLYSADLSTSFAAATEQDIFTALRMNYYAPEQRLRNMTHL